MATKIKVNAKDAKEDISKLTFDTDDFVVIKLKADGKLYVEHKHFAQRLVDRKLADFDKTAKVDAVKSNTTILQND